MQVTDVNTKEEGEIISSEEPETMVVVEEEISPQKIGKFVGQCKWFNDLLGYGFVTVCDGNDKGKDIFVHHSGIMPLNSNYRTLKKGEYLNFDIINGMNGLQAVDVTGINGGPLMCDFVSTTKFAHQPHSQNTNTPRQYPRQQQTSQSPRNSDRNQVSTPQNTRHTNTGVQRGNAQPQIGTQWYVVTKTGRKKNLAKYSKEGRILMKQAKEATQ